MQNLIVAVFTPVDTAVNIGSAHIQGVETELTLRLADWLALQASYTYTDAQNADTGSRLLRRPQNTAPWMRRSRRCPASPSRPNC